MSGKRANRDPPSGRRRARAQPGEPRYSPKAASVRVDPEMLARIDAIAAARNVTRAEAVRALIVTGLPLTEEEAVRARRKAIKLVKNPDPERQP